MTPVEQARAFIKDNLDMTQWFEEETTQIAYACRIMQALLRHIDANEAMYRVRTASLDEALAVIADGGIPGQLSFIEDVEMEA